MPSNVTLDASPAPATTHVHATPTASEVIRLELSEHEAEHLATLLRSADWSGEAGEVYCEVWTVLAELDIRGDA